MNLAETIERSVFAWAWAAAAAATVAAVSIAGTTVARSVAVGAGLGLLNLYALRALSQVVVGPRRLPSPRVMAAWIAALVALACAILMSHSTSLPAAGGGLLAPTAGLLVAVALEGVRGWRRAAAPRT